MTERRFGLIVIGDELLSGKRQDKHFPKLVTLLHARGLELSWVRFIGDDPALIQRTLGETFASGDIVISCGGIGATPDDRTRECAAAALGVPLARHPDGVAELEARFGRPVKPDQRLRLVDFPQGSTIIPNPVNRVPGFAIREHYFVPGFPNMAWPMMEWVLDVRYPQLHAPGSRVEQAISVDGAKESDVIPLMERFVKGHPELRLSCLPSTEPQGFRLELGLRGPADAVAAGMEEIRAEVEHLGFAWTPVTPPSDREE
ncbi:MAG: molybdopterin-binding protein [Arhodomonas sp.]|nr:molybdopterin-binding protein [Arhodomonas sp.]